MGATSGPLRRRALTRSKGPIADDLAEALKATSEAASVGHGDTASMRRKAFDVENERDLFVLQRRIPDCRRLQLLHIAEHGAAATVGPGNKRPRTDDCIRLGLQLETSEVATKTPAPPPLRARGDVRLD